MMNRCSNRWGVSRVAVLVFLFAGVSPVLAQDFIRLGGHAAAATGVAYSPDGTRAATASDDQTVRVWSLPAGILLRTFGHFDDVKTVVFSPEGTKILTGSDDNLARIWDLRTGRELRFFDHLGDVNAVAYSPDGLFIATGSEDNEARLWNASSGELLAAFTHVDDVNAVAFSPDGKQLLTGSADGSAYLWDITTYVLSPPALTPTPTATPSPTPRLLSPSPNIVFSLERGVEFGREPGGFTGAPAGQTQVGAIPLSQLGLSDGLGAIITTGPGQVELLTFPTIEVGDQVVLVRASVQADGPGAVITLAVVDQSLDGSLTLNTQADSFRFVGEYRQLVGLYKPAGDKVLPIFQVANTLGQSEVNVYLDQLEIYLLPRDGVIPNDLLFGRN